MRRGLAGAAIAALVALGACGGDDDSDGTASSDAGAEAAEDSGSASTSDNGAAEEDGSASSGEVVDRAAPGRATAAVDGLAFDFELPGGLACSISDDAITFSYRIGDNEVVLGGGANRADDGWIGGIDLRIANPDGEPGPIAYYPAPGDDGIIDGSRVAVDGDSMSYSGPMLKQPPNDGTNPPPVDAGDGTISATC